MRPLLAVGQGDQHGVHPVEHREVAAFEEVEPKDVPLL